VLGRNIRVLAERRAREAAEAPLQERLAMAVTRFAGSMAFVGLHVLLFGAWIVANLGSVPGLTPWDPTFVTLAMWASVEAIFLTSFVLIGQNRAAAADAERADLDLQVSLLAEHELTRIATVVAAIAQRLEVRTEADPEMPEIERDVAPEAVLDGIAAQGTP
jgi:uncharacterized membrane protein